MNMLDPVRVDKNDQRSKAENLMLSLSDIVGRAKFDFDSEKAHALSIITKFTSFIRTAVVNDSAEPVIAPAAGGLAQWQVQRLQILVDENFDQKISVGVLSAHINLSPSHFARAFKKTFGDTPYNYILRRRVKCAKQLLASTVLPLDEIALRCGFYDQAHLCKTFRQVIGQTPSTWRRYQRQEIATR